MTTLTIMRILPREVDPLVYHMAAEDPGKVSYSDIGGLGDQIRMIREVIELPLINPGEPPPPHTCKLCSSAKDGASGR